MISCIEGTPGNDDCGRSTPICCVGSFALRKVSKENAVLCKNISAERKAIGAGVLIRALMPTLGLPIMHRNRARVPVRNLARGPGRLCAALGLSLDLSGMPIETDGTLTIGEGADVPLIEASHRIGITRNSCALWPIALQATRLSAEQDPTGGHNGGSRD
ncbi:DNA-3-methyladenine glycosylase [uncultured Hyphomicrobium sp.]|uniref:DNA-3-methyladenine glycosylase n=1 Tax=uncultured Hyphomicrobium sp. TaxID=194373 RepID=UPI00345394D7